MNWIRKKYRTRNIFIRTYIFTHTHTQYTRTQFVTPFDRPKMFNIFKNNVKSFPAISTLPFKHTSFGHYWWFYYSFSNDSFIFGCKSNKTMSIRISTPITKKQKPNLLWNYSFFRLFWGLHIFQTVNLIYVLEKSKVKLFDWNKWFVGSSGSFARILIALFSKIT